MANSGSHVLQTMLERARRRGVTSYALREKVHELVTAGVHPDNWRYNELWIQANEISAKGLRSQLSYLIQALGIGGAADVVDAVNVLDTFTKATTSAEEPWPIDEPETEDLDEDGDPWE